MKLSTRGRYGLRAMIDLGINCEQCNVSIKKIADRQHISENYLEHIISDLKKHGLVKSTRGKQGGYSLNKPAEEITSGDILRALEGSLNPVECNMINEGTSCTDSENCATKVLWKKIGDSINEVVDSVTLKDLIDEQKAIKDNVVRSC